MVRGRPRLSRQVMLTLRFVTKSVFSRSRLRTTAGSASLRTSITIRMPALSDDSSRMSEMPSIFFSSTSSASFSTNSALTTR